MTKEEYIAQAVAKAVAKARAAAEERWDKMEEKGKRSRALLEVRERVNDWADGAARRTGRSSVTIFVNLMSLSRAAGKVNSRGTPMHAGEDAEKMVGVAAEAFMRLFDDLVDHPYFFCKTGQ